MMLIGEDCARMRQTFGEYIKHVVFFIIVVAVMVFGVYRADQKSRLSAIFWTRN